MAIQKAVRRSLQIKPLNNSISTWPLRPWFCIREETYLSHWASDRTDGYKFIEGKSRAFEVCARILRDSAALFEKEKAHIHRQIWDKMTNKTYVCEWAKQSTICKERINTWNLHKRNLSVYTYIIHLSISFHSLTEWLAWFIIPWCCGWSLKKGKKSRERRKFDNVLPINPYSGSVLENPLFQISFPCSGLCYCFIIAIAIAIANDWPPLLPLSLHIPSVPCLSQMSSFI